MITNKDAEVLVKEIFTNMESSLNKIEDIFSKPEAESFVSNLGYNFGVIRENYKMLVKLLNIFPEQGK